jgi:hypothetical protein
MDGSRGWLAPRGERASAGRQQRVRFCGLQAYATNSENITIDIRIDIEIRQRPPRPEGTEIGRSQLTPSRSRAWRTYRVPQPLHARNHDWTAKKAALVDRHAPLCTQESIHWTGRNPYSNGHIRMDMGIGDIAIF